MRQADYMTAAMGKWQVFMDAYVPIDKPMPGAPWNRGGFDYYLGDPRGSTGNAYVDTNWEFDRHGILGEAMTGTGHQAPQSRSMQ